MADKQKRMEWLDAMRGFTMLLVVAAHVSTKSFDIPVRASSLHELTVLFRMPLFFFVSGFLAYKSAVLWSGQTLTASLLKKLRVQLLPTLVFFSAFMIYRNCSWERVCACLADSYKGGYWFTWVLLLMFVCYYLFAWAEQGLQRLVRRPCMRWLPVGLFFLLSMLLYESTYLPRVFTYPGSDWAKATSLNCFAGYFCYFLLGNLCRRFWPRAERLFDSRWFFPLLVATAFLCSAEILKWHHLRFAWRNLPRTIDILALMGIILLTFRHYADSFSRGTRAGRILQYIGTRTLDVYLIHYFFLPKVPAVGEWFARNPKNLVIEETCILGTALLVIAFSLLTSAILRTSPLLMKYLFGRETKPAEQKQKTIE